MSNVDVIERQVQEIDNISVKLVYSDGRDARSDREVGGDYPFERAAKGDYSVAEYKEARFSWLPNDLFVEVIGADGNRVHGRTLLKNLRRRAA